MSASHKKRQNRTSFAALCEFYKDKLSPQHQQIEKVKTNINKKKHDKINKYKTKTRHIK